MSSPALTPQVHANTTCGIVHTIVVLQCTGVQAISVMMCTIYTEYRGRVASIG